MSALLLDPHGDDAVLFCCYTLLREKPHVVVTHPTVPREETAAAMEVLGCDWTQWTPINEYALRTWLRSYMAGDSLFVPDEIYAPIAEPEGHEEHNAVGVLAMEVFHERVRPYLTYAPRGQRSTWGTEVVPTAEEIALKLRALSCFESQIEQPSTRPWFFELLDLREWVAE